MTKLKRLPVPSADKDLEFSHIASGNVKQYNHFENIFSTAKHTFIILCVCVF